ncbi:hypothetical protein PFISCL1PPCAC_10785, partial [Pristionchus fissidentatus]
IYNGKTNNKTTNRESGELGSGVIAVGKSPLFRLSETTGLTLSLEKVQDVSLTDGALQVADDGTGSGVIDELDADLSTLSLRSSAAEDLGHLSELDGLVHSG